MEDVEKTLPPEEVARMGEALFGRKWEAPMSRAFRKHPTTIYRWRDSGAPIDSFIAALARYVLTQKTAIEAAEAFIRQAQT